MKANLEFDLPEEQSEFQDAINSWRYKSVIRDLFDWLNQQEEFKPSEIITTEIMVNTLKENEVQDLLL